MDFISSVELFINRVFPATDCGLRYDFAYCLNVRSHLSGLFTAWWLRLSPSVLHYVFIVHVHLLHVFCADPRIKHY